MFNKLRLKLTLINVLVVAAITVFFMAGVYFLMARSLNIQSDQLMRLIATEAGSATAAVPEPGKNVTPPSEEPPVSEHDKSSEKNQFKRLKRERHWFSYFYVKTDNQGKITETSPNLPILKEELQPLINRTLALKNDAGKVEWFDEYDFKFLKAPLKNRSGFTLVYMNKEFQEGTIEHLLGAFAVTGLGGLILALFGSLFMADKALIPIKNSWDRQKKFVADASHELRTPLAVILTNLDIVKGNKHETIDSQKMWLDNIEVESKIMTKLVNDLLFLARIDSEQELLNMSNFSLNLAVNEAINPFNPISESKQIKIETQIENDINFYGDQARIKQLITILVDNAIKYSNPGGNVVIALKDSDNNIEIKVSDTGEGIEEKHLGKIFERFYRVDKARSRDSGGTGLGLSIAESIVKEHRGTIKVTSSPGVGTTFLIILPRN